jgi:hypothetical protein
MLNFALDGFWLLGSLAAVYLLGVFTAQYAKDKLSGVPSELRTVLKNVETRALTALKRSKANSVADAAAAISAPMPVVAKSIVPASAVTSATGSPAAPPV